ncbi:MAG TPA: glycosyltransferase family 1 protein [Croceibacterium sp.]|jgi:glycosyltransferase involved in cell wall biosynthesis
MDFTSTDYGRAASEPSSLPWAEPGPKRAVWIDISRLVWRARHLTPSGIDRVELAYARHFLDHGSRPARFVARINALGGRELERSAVRAFLDDLDRDWSDRRAARPFASLARLLARSRLAPNPDRGITIIPSHQNWHRLPWLKQRRGRGGRLVVFLHDAIPSDYPEYARVGGARRHDQRLTHALQMADAVIVNSQATGDALARFARANGHRQPRLCVAPLGTRIGRAAAVTTPAERPYFLCLGTIEPRKNHMLLLLLWRHMAEAGLPALPRLVIVGRRGWENEQVVDLLERSRGLRGLVEERNAIGDAELWRLMAGARALLMPSFAEGYGMPVAEALAAGTPVIASDLPVYREVAGGIPEYCNPLDGPAWQSAILDYAQAQSPRRDAQLTRLRAWRPPTWADHFRRVEGLLEELD